MFLLAMRYLRGRSKFFFSLNNMLASGGIFLGVLALLIVISVMNGFERDMVDRVVGLKSEIKIHKNDYAAFNYHQLLNEIEAINGVEAAAPVCSAELILQRKALLEPTICQGIDYRRHTSISNVFDKENIALGKPSSQLLKAAGIIIGSELSYALNSTVGDYLTVSSPLGTVPTPFGMLPKSKTMRIVGIVSIGLPEYDRSISFISLENSQYFLGIPANTCQEIAVTTGTPFNSAELLPKLQFAGFESEDWSSFDKNLFQALKVEKIMMFAVLMLMVVIAGFNMAGNFIRLVAEKKQDIGVLQALGCSRVVISRSLLICGVIVGITGAGLATLTAAILLYLQANYQLFSIPIAGFPIQSVPVVFRGQDFIIIPLVAIGISILTTIYPLIKMRTISILDIIKD